MNALSFGSRRVFFGGGGGGGGGGVRLRLESSCVRVNVVYTTCFNMYSAFCSDSVFVCFIRVSE